MVWSLFYRWLTSFSLLSGGPEEPQQHILSQGRSGKHIVLPLHNEGGHHSVDISVGTPAQRFRALVDIGWASAMMPSTLAPSPGPLDRWYHVYNASCSSTSIEHDEKIHDMRYSERTWYDGYKTQDTFAIGDITIEHQAFNNIYGLREEGQTHAEWGALLGLKAKSIIRGSNEESLPSAFQNMIDHGLLEKNVFSLKLAEDEGTGELRLGGIDPAYTDKLVELPVTEVPDSVMDISSGWHVDAHSLTIGDLDMEVDDFYAIFETTTVGVRLPHRLAERVYAELERFPNSAMPCAMRETGPSLSFALGSQRTRFTIPPSQYIERLELDSERLCWLVIDSHRELENKVPSAVFLGTKSLHSYYSVFDVDARSVSRKC